MAGRWRLAAAIAGVVKPRASVGIQVKPLVSGRSGFKQDILGSTGAVLAKHPIYVSYESFRAYLLVAQVQSFEQASQARPPLTWLAWDYWVHLGGLPRTLNRSLGKLVSLTKDVNSKSCRKIRRRDGRSLRMKTLLRPHLHGPYQSLLEVNS
jgi:hypothetical protein